MTPPDAQEPHRIRLRDWESFSTSSGEALLRRHFHRPTNLTGCTVQVLVEGVAPHAVTINGAPLPCVETSKNTTTWQVDVKQLIARNLIECTYASLPQAVDVCLAIFEPAE